MAPKRKSTYIRGKGKKRKIENSARDHKEARKEVGEEIEVTLEPEKVQDEYQTESGTEIMGEEVYLLLLVMCTCSQGWASSVPTPLICFFILFICVYMCCVRLGVWFEWGFFLSYSFLLVCYAHVFPCTVTKCCNNFLCSIDGTKEKIYV